MFDFAASRAPLLQREGTRPPGEPDAGLLLSPGGGSGAVEASRQQSAAEPEEEVPAEPEGGEEEERRPQMQRAPSTVGEWVDEQRPWQRARRPCLRGLLACLCRCGARCLDAVWALGARCVVADLAFSYTWSSFLTCASFLAVAAYMLEFAFDSVLHDLPSCGRCSQARLLTGCRRAASSGGGESRGYCGLSLDTVPLDPFGEVGMKMDDLGWSMLVTVALVSVANSRYVKGWWCLSLLVLPAALLSCCVYALFGVLDFFRVCNDAIGSVDWQPFAPAGAGSGWPGPPPGPARRIAEYCRADMHRVDNPLEEDGNQDDERQVRVVASSVKNMWAAWMPSATFSVELDSCGDLAAYCGHAGRDMPGCLMWLNSSSAGNSLRCHQKLLDPVFILAGCAAPGSPSPFDQAEIPLGCSATVSGRSFSLGNRQLSEDESGAVAYHLLSLATRGLGCPADSAPEGSGPLQRPGDASACTFDRRLLASATGGRLLMPAAWAQPYLHEGFFRCVVEDVSRCSLLELGSSRTFFRSLGATACSLLLLVGFLWLLFLRASACLCPRCRVGAAWSHAARPFLASRIVWGYAIVSLMQAGFTWTAFKVLLSYKIHNPFIWMGFQLQVVVVVLAVVYNSVQYVSLRRQIMSLPSAVLFGDEPAPASYSGPDIDDFREMGTSSLLYAMYFPGMLFWRFFFASWILVSILVSLCLLCATVFKPKAEHDAAADKLWHLLSAMLFMTSVAIAHFLTRVFMQHCLLREDEKGIRVRCACLFSWWELMSCFLGLALGPATSLFDFVKGFVTTAVASLAVHRPNFTQFGELSDYVFCTYCASLYLERMAEDLRRQPETRGLEDLQAEGHVEFVRLDAYDAGEFGPEGVLPLEEPSYRYHCPARCLCFLLLFVGVPLLAACILDLLRAHYGYPCDQANVLLPCWSADTL